MRISPALLLLMLVTLVFAPTIQEWATRGGGAWHRPYQLWLAVIIFVWWTVKRARWLQGSATSSLLKDKE